MSDNTKRKILNDKLDELLIYAEERNILIDDDSLRLVNESLVELTKFKLDGQFDFNFNSQGKIFFFVIDKNEECKVKITFDSKNEIKTELILYKDYKGGDDIKRAICELVDILD